MSSNERRCGNCGAPTNGALCAPCEQDRLYEQEQIKAEPAHALPCSD